MDIAWFRDLIICISGLVVAAVFVFIAILAYSFYKREKRVLDSIEEASKAVYGIAATVGERMISPVVQMMSIIQGVRQGIEVVNKLFKKEEGGKDG